MTKKLNDLVYFGYGTSCPVTKDSTSPEGLAIYAKGSISLQLWYGFSMVATIEGGAVKVHEADGFVKANGVSDMTFEVYLPTFTKASSLTNGRSAEWELLTVQLVESFNSRSRVL